MSDQPIRNSVWPNVAPRAYEKPPILEAAVELRFADHLSDRFVERLSKRVGKKYETVKIQREVLFELNVESGTTDVKKEAIVYRHASHDQADSFTAKPASIAWSRLAPYSGWAGLEARVQVELDSAASVIGPRKIERLGLRYVNRIDVPKDAESGVYRYEDYIAVTISVPEFLDPLFGYQWRVESEFPEAGLKAMIQSAILPPEIPDTAAFLLDIDVSTLNEIELKTNEIMERLRTMRELKNVIFESSITDRARGSFN